MLEARLLNLIGTNQADRHYGGPGHVSQPGYPDFSLIEVAIAGAGALGVDTEDLALVEAVEGSFEGLHGLFFVGAVDRNNVDDLEEGLHGLALKTR